MNQRRKPQHYTRKVDGKVQSINEDVNYQNQKSVSDQLGAIGSYKHYRDEGNDKKEKPNLKVTALENFSSSLGKGAMYSAGTCLACGAVAIAFPATAVVTGTLLPFIAGGVGLYKVMKTIVSNNTYNGAIDLGFSREKAIDLAKKGTSEVDMQAIKEGKTPSKNSEKSSSAFQGAKETLTILSKGVALSVAGMISPYAERALWGHYFPEAKNYIRVLGPQLGLATQSIVQAFKDRSKSKDRTKAKIAKLETKRMEFIRSGVSNPQLLDKLNTQLHDLNKSL